MPARAGLVGNPSDGYGGAVLAVPLPSLVATVEVRPANRTRIDPAAPLLRAAADVVVRHLAARGVEAGPIELRWSTAIPRSVGLAGSSALAVAAIRAIAASRGVVLGASEEAALALAVEVQELGIAAGWQDRMVQAEGVPVLVDCAGLGTGPPDPARPPAVRRVALRAPLRLVVGWRGGLLSDSGEYHAALRRQADPQRMAELGALAHDAAAALGAADLDRVADLIDAGWRLRREVAPLLAGQADLVERVRSCGLPATTPGSGGSVVALVRDDVEVARAVDALREVDASFTTVVLT